MHRYSIISFNHKSVALDVVGCYHLDDTIVENKLKNLKEKLGLEELMYLSTCNRVEFHVVGDIAEDIALVERFQEAFSDGKFTNHNASVYSGLNAVKHLFEVASSLNSLVVGEREIITQVRSAYEKCQAYQLTGDVLRIVVRKAIEVAKKVYTDTEIARRPVSVVSLAYHQLRKLNIALDARILIIGAGKTNNLMSKFLKKHGFTNFTVFNRTLVNAEALANDLQGTAYDLDSLENYQNGFDVIISCTGSKEVIVNETTYCNLLQGQPNKKVAIDLAIPNDIDISIAENYDLELITVDRLKTIAAINLKAREKELEKCSAIIVEKLKEFETLFNERQVELAMRTVPETVKEIKQIAIREVFAKDLSELDDQSREVLDKVLNYMEKKYISVPMKLAKDIMLKPDKK